MSEVDPVSAIVSGLSGNGRDLVFISLILLGCYMLFKQTFFTLVQNVTEQLKNITEELKKTRDTLITMQQSQININEKLENVDDRLEKVENKISQNK